MSMGYITDTTSHGKFLFTYFWAINDEYAKDEEDKEICEHHILYWQPHLTKEMLYSCDVYKARVKKWGRCPQTPVA